MYISIKLLTYISQSSLRSDVDPNTGSRSVQNKHDTTIKLKKYDQDSRCSVGML